MSDSSFQDEADSSSSSAAERPALPPLVILPRPGVYDNASEEFSSPKREIPVEFISEDNVAPKRRRVQHRALKNATIKKYNHLLEQETDVFLGHDLLEERELLSESRRADNSSKYGTVIWEAGEKAKFFRALDRLGRLDIPGITAAVGSKSQTEVADLLLLLNDNYQVRYELAEKTYLNSFADFPAALEVEPDLEAALDELADDACRDDWERFKRKVITEFGEGALIDAAKARSLNHRLLDDVKELRSVIGTLDFAQCLLNIPKMMRLSADLFMVPENDSERAAIEPNNDCSIASPAAIQLSLLVASVTERLVASAHFLALSRVRVLNEQRPGHVGNAVRRKDVLAAAGIVGLPTSLPAFWAAFAKRQGIEINEANSKEDVITDEEQRRPSDIGSDEQANDTPSRRLFKHSPRHNEYDRFSSKGGAEARSMTGSLGGTGENASSVSEFSEGRQRSRSRSRQIRRSSSVASNYGGSDFADSDTDDGELEQEEEVAEQKDHAAQLADENSLRTLLDLPTPPTTGEGAISPSQSQISGKSRRSRGRSRSAIRKRTGRDGRDWRDRMRYRAEWENFARPVSNDAFRTRTGPEPFEIHHDQSEESEASEQTQDVQSQEIDASPESESDILSD